MYAVVPYPTIVSFVEVLHEGGIYEISLFSLLKPRVILRPVESLFTMLISQSTVLKRKDESVAALPCWVYCLTPFADLPMPSETPERLVGKIFIPSHVFKSFLFVCCCCCVVSNAIVSFFIMQM